MALRLAPCVGGVTFSVVTHQVCRNEPSSCDAGSLDFAGDDLKNVHFAPLQEIAEAPKA